LCQSSSGFSLLAAGYWRLAAGHEGPILKTRNAQHATPWYLAFERLSKPAETRSHLFTNPEPIDRQRQKRMHQLAERKKYQKQIRKKDVQHQHKRMTRLGHFRRQIGVEH
jgi:hypothetical protein